MVDTKSPERLYLLFPHLQGPPLSHPAQSRESYIIDGSVVKQEYF